MEESAKQAPKPTRPNRKSRIELEEEFKRQAEENTKKIRHSKGNGKKDEKKLISKPNSSRFRSAYVGSTTTFSGFQDPPSTSTTDRDSKSSLLSGYQGVKKFLSREEKPKQPIESELLIIERKETKEEDLGTANSSERSETDKDNSVAKIGVEYKGEITGKPYQSAPNNQLSVPNNPGTNSSVQVEFTKDGEKGFHIKCFSCVDGEKIRTVVWKGYLAADVVYSMIVSIMFATLAYQRANGNVGWALTYSISSFVMNFPMAIKFGMDFVDFIKRLVTDTATYKICGVTGLALGSLTTFAGIKVAQDSVSKIKYVTVHPALEGFGVSFFSFNTLSTRFVGATGLIYMFVGYLTDFIYSKLEKWKPWYQLLEDLQLHGGKANVELPNFGTDENGEQFAYTDGNRNFTPKAYHDFAKLFYAALTEKNIQPGRDTQQQIEAIISFIIKGGLFYLSLYLVPMWLGLTANGLNALDEFFHKNHLSGWAKDVVLVWFAAAANQFFYCYSSWDWLPTVKEIGVPLWNKASTKVGEWNKELVKRGSQLKPCHVVTLAAAGGGVAVMTWLTLAWFSGSGYSHEMQEQQEDDFGYVASTTYLDHSEIRFFFYDLLESELTWVAMFFAGVIANGRGSLKLLPKLPMIGHELLPCVFPKPKEGALVLNAKIFAEKLARTIAQGDKAMRETFGEWERDVEIKENQQENSASTSGWRKWSWISISRWRSQPLDEEKAANVLKQAGEPSIRVAIMLDRQNWINSLDEKPSVMGSLLKSCCAKFGKSSSDSEEEHLVNGSDKDYQATQVKQEPKV